MPGIDEIGSFARRAGSTKCGMINCSALDARLGDEVAQRARAAQAPQSARCAPGVS